MSAKTKLDWLEKCGYGPKVMKRVKVCPHCGMVVRDKQSVCPACGMRLLGKTLYDRYRDKHLCCDKCGTVLSNDSRYCPHCGRKLYLKVTDAETGVCTKPQTVIMYDNEIIG